MRARAGGFVFELVVVAFFKAVIANDGPAILGLLFQRSAPSSRISAIFRLAPANLLVVEVPNFFFSAFAFLSSLGFGPSTPRQLLDPQRHS